MSCDERRLSARARARKREKVTTCGQLGAKGCDRQQWTDNSDKQHWTCFETQSLSAPAAWVRAPNTNVSKPISPYYVLYSPEPLSSPPPPPSGRLWRNLVLRLHGTFRRCDPSTAVAPSHIYLYSPVPRLSLPLPLPPLSLCPLPRSTCNIAC